MTSWFATTAVEERAAAAVALEIWVLAAGANSQADRPLAIGPRRPGGGSVLLTTLMRSLYRGHFVVSLCAVISWVEAEAALEHRVCNLLAALANLKDRLPLDRDGDAAFHLS